MDRTRAALVLGAAVTVVAIVMGTASVSAATVALDDLLATEDGVPTGLELVAERYRQLGAYTDRAQLAHVVTPPRGMVHRVETEIRCEVSDRDLAITTPWRQLSGFSGLLRGQDGPLERARRDYDLWLAPHLAFRFREHPVRDFRGTEDAYEVTLAEPIVRDGRTLVRFLLVCGTGPGSSDFAVVVDPVSRLIVEVEGREPMPDGGTLAIKLAVTPLRVDGRTWVPAGPDVDPGIGTDAISGDPGEPAPVAIETGAAPPLPPVTLPAEPVVAEPAEATDDPPSPVGPRTPES